jgi:alkaline phosphatase
LKHGKPQAFYIHRMPHHGFSETSTASNWVSDSAAGMTAIVTGRKTHNGVISQSDAAVRGKADGAPLKTILEYAEERGLATGVVTNSPIADATPAACYAHSNERQKWGEIFAQLTKPRFGDGVDVVIGAGRSRIFTQTAAMGVDVMAELRSRGYYTAETAAAVLEIPGNAARVAIVTDEDEAQVPLAAAVEATVRILRQSPKGFFLMVESNNHYNDARKTLELMGRFDAIIERTAEALRGTDTLILFTADHSYDLRMPGDQGLNRDVLPSIRIEGHHTAEEVMVAAEGPGSDQVRGFFPNTRLFEIMMRAYGWTP